VFVRPLIMVTLTNGCFVCGGWFTDIGADCHVTPLITTFIIFLVTGRVNDFLWVFDESEGFAVVAHEGAVDDGESRTSHKNQRDKGAEFHLWAMGIECDKWLRTESNRCWLGETG
jgi:hypothetical protein